MAAKYLTTRSAALQSRSSEDKKGGWELQLMRIPSFVAAAALERRAPGLLRPRSAKVAPPRYLDLGGYCS